MGKKLLSIALLLLMAFNLFGYRLYLSYLQEQQARSFRAQIHENRITDELLTLKVPAHLPYYFNSTDYEWVEGEVVVEGVVYQYVKRRIFNDSIEYQCLKNRGRMQIENAREEFFKLCNDLKTPAGEQKPGSTAPVKISLPEYCSQPDVYALSGPAPQQKQFALPSTPPLSTAVHQFPEQPPEGARYWL